MVACQACSGALAGRRSGKKRRGRPREAGRSSGVLSAIKSERKTVKKLDEASTRLPCAVLCISKSEWTKKGITLELDGGESKTFERVDKVSQNQRGGHT